METRSSVPEALDTAQAMCPSLQALDLVKDRWSIKVMMLLRDGPRRYMQLKRHAGGTTQKMLTQTLRKLEQAELVTRTVYPTSPPTVEYALTSLGEQLQAPLAELVQWAQVYTAHVQPRRETDADGERTEDR